jgi:IS30 family transposase
MNQAGSSQRSVARAIGRAPSTISREVQRNRCPVSSAYDHAAAQVRARERRTSRGPRARTSEALESLVWLLGEGFTAGQIALFGIGVSERTCYRLIFSDRQGARSTVIYLVVVGLDGGVAVGAEGPFQIEEISPNARLRRTNAAR